MSSKSKAALIALAILSLGSCSNEPKNYDDCILKYLKPGMTNDVAAEVMKACQRKFGWWNKYDKR